MQEAVIYISKKTSFVCLLCIFRKLKVNVLIIMFEYRVCFCYRLHIPNSVPYWSCWLSVVVIIMAGYLLIHLLKRPEAIIFPKKNPKPKNQNLRFPLTNYHQDSAVVFVYFPRQEEVVVYMRGSKKRRTFISISWIMDGEPASFFITTHT